MFYRVLECPISSTNFIANREMLLSLVALPLFCGHDHNLTRGAPVCTPLIAGLFFVRRSHSLSADDTTNRRDSLPSSFIPSRLTPLRPPPRRPKPGDGLELAVAELDVGGADHARLEAQGGADVVVDGGGGVVAHDEVVAVGVLHLVDGDGLGEGEDAPVGEAADDAAVAEDEGAYCLGDSVFGESGGVCSIEY